MGEKELVSWFGVFESKNGRERISKAGSVFLNLKMVENELVSWFGVFGI
ncbi:MAG: hypothetical protein K0R05_3823 [Anaerocolumna sp.]|nr:hypothetical protein [Anaerocolumna sp.]